MITKFAGFSAAVVGWLFVARSGRCSDVARTGASRDSAAEAKYPHQEFIILGEITEPVCSTRAGSNPHPNHDGRASRKVRLRRRSHPGIVAAEILLPLVRIHASPCTNS
jgi:hypothetical protein